MEEEKQKQKSPNIIPLAIIIAGIFIAGAIYSSNSNGDNPREKSINNEVEEVVFETVAKTISPVTAEDHVFGNRDTEISIIEFSDLECPFCARAHETISQLISEYPDDVHWAYRHFPLTQIHNEAMPAAIASECVSSLAGNDAFWNFVSNIFKDQDSMSDDFYVTTARDLGINEASFSACMDKQDTKKILAQSNEAVAVGGEGTPYFVILSPQNDPVIFSGALPITEFRSTIENLR